MKHLASINLLRTLRDWPKPKRPHASLIVLVAIASAYPGCMREKYILAELERGNGAATKPITALLAEGLIERTGAADRNSGAYAVTAEGRAYLDEIAGREGKRSDLIPLLRTLRDWPRPDLPHSQLIILLALHQADAGTLRSNELAGLLHRNRCGVATTAKALVAAGLVETRRNARDIRSHDFILTPAGRKRVPELFKNPTPTLS
jgi:DNA-binding MarR family transcriptional regulator